MKVDSHAFFLSDGLLLGKCDYGFVSFTVNRVWLGSEYTGSEIAVVIKYRGIEKLVFV